MKRIAIAATSHGANRLDVLGIGTDNQMYHNWYESVNRFEGGWGGWESFSGGVFSSPPAVVAREDLLLDIYGVGADNQMYHRRAHTHSKFPASPAAKPVISVRTAAAAVGLPAQVGEPVPVIPAAATPDTWEALGGVMSSPIAAVSWGPSRLDSFYVGTDSQMWHNWWDGNLSGGGEPLGGLFASPPAAVSWGDHRIDVFALGLDDKLYHKWCDASGWYPSAKGWELLDDALLNTQPAAVSWGPNQLDVFALDENRRMLHKAFDGTWHPAESLGGFFSSPPAAVCWGPGRLDVFAVGTDDQMYHNWYENGWGGWESLGGLFISAPAAVSWGDHRLDVFGIGRDNQMYRRLQDRDTNGWYPSTGWEALGTQFNLPRPNCAPVDVILHAFYLHNRRSGRFAMKDSVKISFGLKVDDREFPIQYNDYGDIGDENRWYGVSMNFPAVPITRNSQVTVSFAMINAGHSANQDQVKDSPTTVSDKALKLGVGAAPESDVWEPYAEKLLNGIIGWALANCDGPLAADLFQLDGGAIIDGDWNASKGYLGTDSSTGCGSNSNYHVVVYTRPRGNWGLKTILQPNETMPVEPTGGFQPGMVSRSGDFILRMQADGNLVVYDARALNVYMAALWSSRTNGQRVDRCIMQADGNLVLYNGSTAVWASNTNGYPGAYAILQDDGNFVIYSTDGQHRWASNTNFVARVP